MSYRYHRNDSTGLRFLPEKRRKMGERNANTRCLEERANQPHVEMEVKRERFPAIGSIRKNSYGTKAL